jgi:ubiquinone/menaquinone biosynthesis C-methylase UbiE
MTFETQLATRNAVDYADFLLPYLPPDAHVLDVGCGAGTISLGLAKLASHVLGVDLDEAEFADARAYALQHNVSNVEFRSGSVYALQVPDTTFDACLCHSMLEAIERPLDALQEIKRTLAGRHSRGCLRRVWRPDPGGSPRAAVASLLCDPRTALAVGC